MADRFYGYQYDTNPRKLNSEFSSYRRGYPERKEPVDTTSRNHRRNTKRNAEGAYSSHRRNNAEQSNLRKSNVPEYGRRQVVSKNNRVNNGVRDNRKINEKGSVQSDSRTVKVTKANVKAKLKIVCFLAAVFSVLFAISYQNSLIGESFNKKEQYKKEMEAISKTNQQIEVSIENSLNLNNIEQVAKERLGMQKLNNSQKVYVSLPKEDYVAPAGEEIVMEEEQSFWQKLLNGIFK